jgi:hypothetical protein
VKPDLQRRVLVAVLSLGGTVIAVDRLVLGTGMTDPDGAAAAVPDANGQQRCANVAMVASTHDCEKTVTIADRLQSYQHGRAKIDLVALTHDPIAPLGLTAAIASARADATNVSLRSIHRAANGQTVASLWVAPIDAPAYASVVRVGEAIQGKLIRAIEHDRVILEERGELLVMTLPIPKFKRQGPDNRGGVLHVKHQDDSEAHAALSGEVAELEGR